MTNSPNHLPEQLYQELRDLAKKEMNGQRRNHTLQPTALVHEAYMRMARYGDELWKDKQQFRALAATCIRHILIEYARRRGASKREGGFERVTLGSLEAEVATGSRDAEIGVLDLVEVLDELELRDPRMSRLVELRYLGGLTLVESAQQLEMPVSTAQKQSRFALAWMRVKLAPPQPD